MPYEIPRGRGSHTGQVLGRKPHRMGTWRAAADPVGFVEGEWFYGLHLRSTLSRNRDGHGVAVEALQGPAPGGVGSEDTQPVAPGRPVA